MRPTQIGGGRTFVGRENEQRAFAAAIAEIAQAPNRSWFWGRTEVPRSQPRVFLVQGSAASGKSSLLAKFADQCAASLEPIHWVALDWEEIFDQRDLPEDFPAFLLRVFRTIRERIGNDVSRHFRAFTAVHENYSGAKKKVDSERANFLNKIVSLAANLSGKALQSTMPVPVPGIDKLAELGVEHMLRPDGVLSREWNAHLYGVLSPDEYGLFTNSNEPYAAKFVEGLCAVAENTPLVLAQDAYERVQSGGKLDGLIRTLVVKPAVAKCRRLAFVIASRGELADEYRRSFEAEPSLLYETSLSLFSEAETAQLLSARGIPETAASDVQRATKGVPLAVDLIAASVPRASDGTVVEPLPPIAEIADVSDALGRTISRILSYTFPVRNDPPEVAKQKTIDRHHIYALALLRAYDPGAIRACWSSLQPGSPPLSDADVSAKLQELRRRHEFLFERNATRMQSPVRDYIRDYLRREMNPERGSLDRDVVRDLSRSALAYFQQIVAEREKAVPLMERGEDNDWRVASANAVHHQAWVDAPEALRTLACKMLVAGYARKPWLAELLAEATIFSTSDQPFLVALRAGIEELRSDEPRLAPVIALWDAIAASLPGWNRPAVYQSLLALRRGMIMTAQQPAEAADVFAEGLKTLDDGADPALREQLLKGMGVCAAVLIFETKNYSAAVSITDRILAIAGEDPQILTLNVSARMGVRDYAGAQFQLDDFIARHPNSIEHRGTRYALLAVQGRAPEARQELREIARLRPSFFAEQFAQNISSLSDPKFRRIVMDWQLDIGMSPDMVNMYSKMLDSVSPEVFSELMDAWAKLNIAEDPSPQQLLELRELFVRHLPDFPSVQAEVGVSYVLAGRVSEAVTAFERAEALAPGDARFTAIPALVLAQQECWNDALPFVQRAYDRMPGNPGPTLVLIACYRALDRLSEALQCAEHAIATMPDNGHLRFQYGQLLAETGQQELGWRVQREAYLASPEILEESKRALGALNDKAFDRFKKEALAGMGEIGDVLRDLPRDDVIRICAEVDRARLESAVFGTAEPSVLVPVLEELLTVRPDNGVIRLGLVSLHEATGSSDKAIALLEGVGADSPVEIRQEAHRALVRHYARLDNAPGALRHLRQVADPTAAELRLLAALFEVGGEFDDALDAYDRAQAVEEDTYLANVQKFGQYNLYSGRFERGKALLARLPDQRALSPEVRQALAYALSEKGDWRAAEAELQQVLAVEPENAAVLARLSRLYRAMSREEEAEAARAKALSCLATAVPYDQACTLALLDRREEARAKLDEALLQDPSLRAWASLDPDLRGLVASAGGKAAREC